MHIGQTYIQSPTVVVGYGEGLSMIKDMAASTTLGDLKWRIELRFDLSVVAFQIIKRLIISVVFDGV